MTKTRLEDRGKILEWFSGRGTIHEDNYSITGDFQLAQLSDARIYLEFTSSTGPRFSIEGPGPHYDIEPSFKKVRFEGLNQEGNTIVAKCHGRLGVSYTLPFRSSSSEESETEYIFSCKNITCIGPQETPSFIEFSLSNLLIPYNTVIELAGKKIALQKVDNYEVTSKVVKATRSADVTAKIIIPIEDIEEIEDTRKLVDSISILLTLARGTHITWLNWKVFSTERTLISARYRNCITRDFCSLYLIDPYDVKATTDYLGIGLASLKPAEKNWNLWHVIHEYAESRIERNILEGRALRASICIEILKNCYLSRQGKNSDLIMKPKQFDSIKEAVRNTLREITPQDILDSILEKVPELNRRSFRPLLIGMCSEVGITIDDDKIGELIKLRNSLVHTGAFLKAKPGEDNTEFRQYLKLDDFVGRFLLATLGYNPSNLMTYAAKLLAGDRR